MAAESDVGQPWAAAAGQSHHQGQVVEQRPELSLPAVDPGRDPCHPGAQRFEQESMLMTPCGPTRKPVLLIHQVPSGCT